MLKKWFGGKDEKESGVPSQAPARASKPSQSGSHASRPPASTPTRSEPVPVLKNDEGAAAEARAKAAMATMAAAMPITRTMKDLGLEEDAGVREEAAARFAAGEQKMAIDLLVQQLNRTRGQSPRPIWFMLMDAYQALDQQAAFEKSASMYADFFKTSPPSWEGESTEKKGLGASMGLNVLVLDGNPAQIHPEKLKAFLSESRRAQHARLDLSRTRLDEDHVQRVEDLKALLALMRKLRRDEVQVLLMGENQLVEILRTVIQKDLPVPSADQYWLLLLEFMQWRGQENAFDELALQFADRFRLSAPGFEMSGIIAQAPVEAAAPAPESESGLLPPAVLDEGAMEQWCGRIETALPMADPPLVLDFRAVRQVSFHAAGDFAARLMRWGRSPDTFSLTGPSELVVALFEITGVAPQVAIEARKR